MFPFLIFLIPCLLHAEVPSVVRRFAPEIIQELGSTPEADEFTRIDFDGDINPHNNWDNLLRFPRPRIVYYDVIESQDHYFVTFGFFFPRDYERVCFWVVCHENDFEGMRVTVDKKNGKAVLLETLAHNYKSEEKNPSKIQVVIEAGGHGVYLPTERKPTGKTKRYTKFNYAVRPMSDLWGRRNTSLFEGSFEFKGRTYPSHFGAGKWTIFGLGVARPPWSWEIHGSSFSKGQWFLEPGTKGKYLNHLVEDFRAQ